MEHQFLDSPNSFCEFSNFSPLLSFPDDGIPYHNLTFDLKPNGLPQMESDSEAKLQFFKTLKEIFNKLYQETYSAEEAKKLIFEILIGGSNEDVIMEEKSQIKAIQEREVDNKYVSSTLQLKLLIERQFYHIDDDEQFGTLSNRLQKGEDKVYASLNEKLVKAMQNNKGAIDSKLDEHATKERMLRIYRKVCANKSIGIREMSHILKKRSLDAPYPPPKKIKLYDYI